MQFKVAVIGCGDRGSNHAKTWQEREDSQVVSVFDIDAKRAESLAAEVNAKVYSDWQKAIMHDGVNVVSVATPTAFHSQVAVYAANNGRHVFCEKPLALTEEQGREMVKACAESKVVFMPCFQNRDSYARKKYREYFMNGAFGGPVIMRFTDVREVRPKTAMHSRSLNGGPIIDMACHYIDLIRFVTGEEPVRAYATGSIFGKGAARLAAVTDLAIDEACIDVIMSGGSRLQVYLNWGMPEKFPSVGGEEIVIGPKMVMRPAEDKLEVITSEKCELIDCESVNGTVTRLEAFTSAIVNGNSPDVGCHDGLIALRTSLALLKSIETGEAVLL